MWCICVQHSKQNCGVEKEGGGRGKEKKRAKKKEQGFLRQERSKMTEKSHHLLLLLPSFFPNLPGEHRLSPHRPLSAPVEPSSLHFDFVLIFVVVVLLLFLYWILLFGVVGCGLLFLAVLWISFLFGCLSVFVLGLFGFTPGVVVDLVILFCVESV